VTHLNGAPGRTWRRSSSAQLAFLLVLQPVQSRERIVNVESLVSTGCKQPSAASCVLDGEAIVVNEPAPPCSIFSVIGFATNVCNAN